MLTRDHFSRTETGEWSPAVKSGPPLPSSASAFLVLYRQIIIIVFVSGLLKLRHPVRSLSPQSLLCLCLRESKKQVGMGERSGHRHSPNI